MKVGFFFKLIASILNVSLTHYERSKTLTFEWLRTRPKRLLNAAITQIVNGPTLANVY